MKRILILLSILPTLAISQVYTEDEIAPQYKKASLGLGFSTRYLNMDRSYYGGALDNNGFSGTKSSGIMWGFHGYVESEDGWRLGGASHGLNNVTIVSSQEAQIDFGYGGVFLSKDIFPRATFDLTIGSLIGGGHASIEVFSTNQNGRSREDFFVLEPQLTLEFNVFRFMKIGLQVSYFYPVGENINSIGDNLGLTKIAKGGWTSGLSFTFGWFGEYTANTRQAL